MNLFSKITFWISWPLIFLVVRNTDRTRVIVRYKNEILLVQGWIGNKKWQLPGGGIKKGEPVKLAAIRELREETGIIIKESKLKDLGNIIISETGLNYMAHYFLVELDNHIDTRRSHEIRVAEFKNIDSIGSDNLTKDVITGIKLIKS